MKALVLGCGSIGVRHIQHLRQLGIEGVEAADPSPQARDRAKTKLGLTVDASPEEALHRRPDVVLVCTPAATHVPMALKALQAGAHVFVEKPLSTTLEGIEALVQQVQSDGRIFQVGYQLRYHPAMKRTQQILQSGRLGKILTAHAEFGLYLDRWWPGRDYRDSYMATDAVSGGLVLDVSHEIDLMIWFLGSVKEVFAFGGKLSDLQMHGPDAVKILMRMENRAIASVHMDCLQPTYTRGYSLVGEATALRWDCWNDRADKSLGHLRLWDTTRGQYESLELEGSPQDAFLDELRDFLSCVEQGSQPMIDMVQGVTVLRVALAVQESMKTGRSMKLPC
jgi:predicted dehydrogenase